jgi:hypothetical protein
MQKIRAEFDYLISAFNLQSNKEKSILFEWINSKPENLDDYSEQTLAKIEPRLENEIDGWLEEELKMKLLAPIFMLADLSEPQKIGVFFERQVSANIDDKRISVVTDCMVSSVLGFTTPQMPYFFMQEFKKSKGDKQDPEGQMLAAMIAAQYLNQNGNTLYGSYVIGRDWYFTVLDGKNYSRSESFRLTQPKELRQVILTLRKLKQIILNDLFD